MSMYLIVPAFCPLVLYIMILFLFIVQRFLPVHGLEYNNNSCQKALPDVHGPTGYILMYEDLSADCENL